MAANWKIEKLDCKADTVLGPKYIITAHWSYGDPDIVPDRIWGGVNFKMDETNTNFVPFEQVTEQMVWDWIWASGEVDQAKIADQFAEMARVILNPIIVSPELPWQS